MQKDGVYKSEVCVGDDDNNFGWTSGRGNRSVGGMVGAEANFAKPWELRHVCQTAHQELRY